MIKLISPYTGANTYIAPSAGVSGRRLQNRSAGSEGRTGETGEAEKEDI